MKIFKKMMCFCLVLSMMMFTGCSMEIQLTDQESEEVAEYIAMMILKHDKNYKQALVTPTPLPTPMPTREDDTTKAQTSQPVSLETGEPEKTEVTFTELAAKADFQIQYLSYEFRQEYYGNTYELNPESGKEPSLTVFHLGAKKGQKLLMISFKIENKSKKAKTFNLIQDGIRYQLKTSEKVFKKPMLTPLENDIQYIKLKFAAKESKAAVIIFEVDDKINIDDCSLVITKDNETATIKLK